MSFCAAEHYFSPFSWRSGCSWVIQTPASLLETWIQNKPLLFHLNFISCLHLSLASLLALSPTFPLLTPPRPTSRMTKPCKSGLTPRSVIWSRFSVVIFPPSQNDPYFKWHSSPLGKWNLCSCQPPLNVPASLLKAQASPGSSFRSAQLHKPERKIQGQKVFNTEQDAISLSLFGFAVHDNEPSQIFIMWLGDYFLLDISF